MNDEQFEATMECLRDELADKLRARDTAQREALARVEAERDTAVVKMQNIRKERDAINKELGDAGFNLCIAQQQLAEAVGLLREVNSQRFTTLATVEIIESFIGRHSQTFHDRAQAEQQEAQGAQAGETNIQAYQRGWDDRAALATQPADQYRKLRTGDIIQATDELMMDDCVTWKPMGADNQLAVGMTWREGFTPIRRKEAAVRGAEHDQ